MVYSRADWSHVIRSRFGLQHTWQSSTKVCFVPAEASTSISFHSPQPAHWNPEVIAIFYLDVFGEVLCESRRRLWLRLVVSEAVLG